jgi:hypothetical protein
MPAKEVTQNVFIALARKAPWWRGEVTRAGWLHKTALLEARQRWRGELRRQRREQTAAELGTTMKEEGSLLKSLTGVLDEGLLELREPERQALMLRISSPSLGCGSTATSSVRSRSCRPLLKMEDRVGNDRTDVMAKGAGPSFIPHSMMLTKPSSMR